jgi:hypothetical protein
MYQLAGERVSHNRRDLVLRIPQFLFYGPRRDTQLHRVESADSQITSHVAIHRTLGRRTRCRASGACRSAWDAVESALGALIDAGRIDSVRCLMGFPHPSGPALTGPASTKSGSQIRLGEFENGSTPSCLTVSLKPPIRAVACGLAGERVGFGPWGSEAGPNQIR